jgi:hypothetical protein
MSFIRELGYFVVFKVGKTRNYGLLLLFTHSASLLLEHQEIEPSILEDFFD